jgi:hypothetical protein
MKGEDIIKYVVFGVAAYWLYSKFKSAQQALSPVGNAIGAGIAWAIVPDAPTVRGAVILPDGSTVALSSIYVNEQMQFVYNNRTYTVTGRDANGNYNAS